MKWITIPGVLLTHLLMALPVLAQNAGKAPVPKATMAKGWVSIAIIFLLAILVAIPSFMSSKRGHQD